MENLIKAFNYFNSGSAQLIVFKTEDSLRICVADEKLVQNMKGILKGKYKSTQCDGFVCIDIPSDETLLTALISSGYDINVIKHRNKDNKLCVPDVNAIKNDIAIDY